MIELLQLDDGHVVHFGNGSQRLAARYHVSSPIRAMGRFRRSWGRRVVRRAFANHYPGPGIGQLHLQFQNLLRQQIDLSILFVDFF